MAEIILAGEQRHTNAFVERLSRCASLSEQDVLALEGICANTRRYPAQQDLIREGDPPGPLYVFLEGWGCRYKMLPEGGRQVLAVMMPGDFCDMHTGLLNEMDHSIAAVTFSQVAIIDRVEMQALIESHPAIAKACWLQQLIDLGVARSWIASLGRRDATERLAHLMCELFFRACGNNEDGQWQCRMPLSQILLADALGLTPAHVSRVLRKLRSAGVMELIDDELVIADVDKLMEIAGFDHHYLQSKLRQLRPELHNSVG
ncbi:MAG: Crp/Fnr family transcriptional regulator [Sphingorhabdus sp.]|nr:Crp/Fnr family transcriptional regulator [Sphingorhabdus sp.]|tara:strand:- start:3935 stop:4714 length:780 start_codon:yes stop_codon:yes gene_type:complete